MIKANDLRIGNLVYHPKTDRNIVVEYHHIRFAVLYPDNGYEPIPLTPEILIAAGFKTDDITYWKEYSINGQVLLVALGYYKGKVFKHLPTNQIHISGITIENVHQLQNLYFALTGQELEIKRLPQPLPDLFI